MMTNNPKDRHVLAAAVAAEAQVIVTLNLKDFPPKALVPYHVEAQHPDAFLTHLFHLDPARMQEAIEMHVRKLRNPTKTFSQVLDTLAQHVPTFAALMRSDSDF